MSKKLELAILVQTKAMMLDVRRAIAEAGNSTLKKQEQTIAQDRNGPNVLEDRSYRSDVAVYTILSINEINEDKIKNKDLMALCDEYIEHLYGNGEQPDWTK